MATEHEEHAHEHSFLSLVDTDAISAYEHVPHRIITVQFHQRGFSLDLTYQEVVALGDALETLVTHVNAQAAGA